MREEPKAAIRTYSGFVRALKWAVPLIAVVTAIVILLIAP